MDKILIGDRVRWECHAGTLRGEVVNIHLALNAKNELCPWLTIEYIDNNKTQTTVLNGTDGYLKMMKFVVNFRDAA